MIVWTPDMVADLQRLWAEGHSSGEIGKRLRVSPVSVLGALSLLGVPGRPRCRMKGAPRHKLQPQNPPDPRDPDHVVDTRDLAMLAAMAGGRTPEQVATARRLPASYTHEIWRVRQLQVLAGGAA